MLEYHLARMEPLDQDGRRRYVDALLRVPTVGEDGTLDGGHFALLSERDAETLRVLGAKLDVVPSEPPEPDNPFAAFPEPEPALSAEELAIARRVERRVLIASRARRRDQVGQ